MVALTGPLRAVAWTAAPGPDRSRSGGLLLAGLLLAGHGLLLALAGARVRLRALAVDGQALAVPDALVAANLDLATDVGLDLAAQVTLDLEVRLDVVTHRDELLVGELVHTQVGAHTGRLEDLLGAGAADAVDVGESDLQPLVAGEVDANQASHGGHSPSLWRRSCAPLPLPNARGGGPWPPTRGLPRGSGPLWGLPSRVWHALTKQDFSCVESAPCWEADSEKPCGD